MSDHRHSAGDPGAVGHDGRTFDPERTVGGDADLLAEVRSAVEAARRGLAAPPGSAGSTPSSTGSDDVAPDDARGEAAGDADDIVAVETAGAAPTAEMAATVGDPSTQSPTLQLPRDPGAALPPPADRDVAPPSANGFGPPAVAGTDVPTRVMAATSPDPTEVLPVQGVPTAQQRWVPPPRLKPAATPTPAAFVDEPPARRGRVWWIVGAAAVVVAAGVGVAVALSGGDPAPSDDTAVSVPASTTVVTPTTASATTARPTTTRPGTTTATTAAPTTAAPTTAAPSTEAPTTPPPETVAPEPPPETTPPVPGG